MKINNTNHWLDLIVQNIPDEELCQLIEEIFEWKQTGILKQDGLFAQYRKQIAQRCDVGESEMTKTTEDAILYEASRRWHNER